MSIVPSLLQAIVHVDGEAMVMHAGEKPYVISQVGQTDLSTRGLTLDAVNGIVGQLLPPEFQSALDEFGAVQYELPSRPEFPAEHFTVVAARGGDDLWVEIRRRRVPEEDGISAPAVAVAEEPGHEPAQEPASPDIAPEQEPAVEPPALAPVFAAVAEEPIVVARESASAAAEPQLVAAPPPIEDQFQEELIDLDAPETFEFTSDVAAPADVPAVEDVPPAAEVRAAADVPAVEEVPAAAVADVRMVPEAPVAAEAAAAIADLPVAELVAVEHIAASLAVEQIVSSEPLEEPAAVAEIDQVPTPVAIEAPPVAIEEAVAAAVERTPAHPVEQTPAPIATEQTSYPVEAEASPIHPAAEAASAPARHLYAVTGPEPLHAESDVRAAALPPAPRTAAVSPPVPVPASPPLTVPTPAPEPEPAAVAAVFASPPVEQPPQAAASVESVAARPSPAESTVATPPQAPAVGPPTPAFASAATGAFVEPPAAIAAPRAVPPVTRPTPPPANVLPMSRNPLRTDASAPEAVAPMAGLEALLRMAAARGASTLYLSSQTRPSVRVDAEVHVLEGEPELSARDVESLLLTLMPERSHEALRTGAATEWICDIEGVGRVRCMSFRDHLGPGGVFRLIPRRSVSADQLGLSRAIQSLAMEPEGLVFVAGPRSSGKRTLIAALVDVINRTRRDHVITIEREINVVHGRENAFISQREVRGSDDEMLAAARAALREDPDVLVIEELRTGGLMNVALEAASSGHLVIAGFSAHTAAAAVDRIIDLYAPEYRRQVQLALADTLRGVVVQVLVRKTGGGRVAAREVLLNTPAVASVLAEGKTSQLPMAIEGGRRHGMVPLNDALVGFVQNGTVDAHEAYRYSPDRVGFLALLKRQGIDTSFAERLA